MKFKHSRKMKVSDIKISKDFEDAKPRPFKIDCCQKYWNMYGEQDRIIVVDKDNVLIDGYVQYLVLKNNGILYAEVVSNCDVVTYVEAKHWNNDVGKWSKPYVWRLPFTSESDKIRKYLQHGTEVIVHTKFGKRMVRITGVIGIPVWEMTNKKIKKVCVKDTVEYWRSKI